MQQPTKNLLGSRSLLVLAVIYSLGITVLFFLPTADLPTIQFSAADKLVHISVYFILINLWQFYIYKRNNHSLGMRWVGILLLSTLFYGIIIEIFQHLFTASREADILDVLANLIGSILGILFFKKARQYFEA